MEEGREIFREQSLEKLSSPDRLDQLLQIVRPHSWLGLGAVAIGILVALAWSFFGRIPARVSGTAILVRPKQVVPFQSPASGQIDRIAVSVGDVIRSGDLLATLDLPPLNKELEQERIRLEQFESRARKMTDLERQLAERERGYLAQQRELIQERLGQVAQDAEQFKSKSDRYLDEQRKNIAIWRVLSEELRGALAEREEARSSLAKDGLLAKDQVLDIRTRVIDNELTLAQLEVREGEIELRANSARETYDGKIDLVRDLKIELHALELRELVITRRLGGDELDNADERQDIERNIERLETQLQAEGSIFSEHDGRVLEIVAARGQFVAIGERLGRIEIEDASAGLMALAYFTVKDGKRIEAQSRIRVSPATVERERFGGMLGEVVRVSDYPVTTAAAANQIGDLEIATTLLGGQNRIEVLAELDVDPDSSTGYRWTSGRGPDGIVISAGTTADARVTIEERRPITLVLPFLRSMFGL